MLVIKGNGTLAAGILTAVSQTAAAGIGHAVTGCGAFVTGDLEYLYDIRVLLVAAHGKTDPLCEYGPFLIDTASHGGFVTGNNGLGNRQDIFKEGIIPGPGRHFPQHLVFQILYFCIKLSHNHLPSYSEIAHLDPLPHTGQRIGQFLHKIHFDIEIDRKVRILVGRVDRPSDIHVDIRRFFK